MVVDSILLLQHVREPDLRLSVGFKGPSPVSLYGCRTSILANILIFKNLVSFSHTLRLIRRFHVGLSPAQDIQLVHRTFIKDVLAAEELGLGRSLKESLPWRHAKPSSETLGVSDLFLDFMASLSIKWQKQWVTLFEL